MRAMQLLLVAGLLAADAIPVDAKIVYNNDTED